MSAKQDIHSRQTRWSGRQRPWQGNRDCEWPASTQGCRPNRQDVAAAGARVRHGEAAQSLAREQPGPWTTKTSAATSTGAWSRRFGPYLAEYQVASARSASSACCSIPALNLANPFLIGVAIDDFISPGRPARADGDLRASRCWRSTSPCGWRSTGRSGRCRGRASRCSTTSAADMFAHLQQLSLSFYDRTQIGRVMSRLQSDIDVLEAMLSSGLLSMLSSVIALVGIVGIMLAMNAPLALLTFTVLPVMIVIAAFWQKLRPALLPPHARGHLAGQRHAAREHLRHARDPEHGARRPQPRASSTTSTPITATPTWTPAASPRWCCRWSKWWPRVAISLTILYGGSLVAHEAR